MIAAVLQLVAVAAADTGEVDGCDIFVTAGSDSIANVGAFDSATGIFWAQCLGARGGMGRYSLIGFVPVY